MKKVFYFLLLAFVASENVSAQNTSNNPFDQSETVPDGTSESIWKTSAQKSDNVSANAKKPPVVTNPGGTTPAPIDGGVVFLLAAGALYGRKKIANYTKANK